MKLRIAAALFTCVSLTMMSVSLYAATASAQDGYSSGTIDPPPTRPPGAPVANPEDPDPTPTPPARPTGVPSTPVEPPVTERPPEPGDPEPSDPPMGDSGESDPPQAGSGSDDGGSDGDAGEAPVYDDPVMPTNPVTPTNPGAPSSPPPGNHPAAPQPAAESGAAPTTTTANGDTTGHLVTVETHDTSTAMTDPALNSDGPIGYGFDRPVNASSIVLGHNDGHVGSVSVTPSISSDDAPVELAYTGPETPYIAYGGLALISAGLLALRARQRLVGPAPKFEYR